VTVAPERIDTRLDAAIEAATNRLLELQHPDGYWVGELESNVTMTAQHLFWHHVLGLRTPELDRKIANELLARQRDDGTWAIWFDGPADLSTSVEAYAALKLAGVDPGAQARDYISSAGGIPRTRIFTKCFLALLGQWPWQRITPIPVELALRRLTPMYRSTTSPAGRGARSSRSRPAARCGRSGRPTSTSVRSAHGPARRNRRRRSRA
jgi:squalene-hopene/tetraprenyl-beta-curcumene cyclase